MKSLLIEACTERSVVAVADSNVIINQKLLPYGLQNSSHLLPAIEELLTNDNIEFIICGIGPGSYTGIRMGAIAAKTLSYALKIPLVGVCTLNCFVPQQNGKFATIIDAKIGGFYVLKGTKTDQFVTYESEPIVCLLADLKRHLNEITLLVTPNKQRIAPLLQQELPDRNFVWEECFPDTHQMAFLGLEMFRKGSFSTNGDLELLYLRKTQAEIEREKKGR